MQSVQSHISHNIPDQRPVSGLALPRLHLGRFHYLSPDKLPVPKYRGQGQFRLVSVSYNHTINSESLGSSEDMFRSGLRRMSRNVLVANAMLSRCAWPSACCIRWRRSQSFLRRNRNCCRSSAIGKKRGLVFFWLESQHGCSLISVARRMKHICVAAGNPCAGTLARCARPGGSVANYIGVGQHDQGTRIRSREKRP